MSDAGHRRLAEYGRFLRLPFALTAPGLPLTGFFLAGGDWTRCPLYALCSICASALFSSFYAETGFPAKSTDTIPSGTKKAVRTVSFLLTLLFSSFRPETFTAAALTLLTGLAAPRIASVTFLGAACTALRFVCLTALGMALLPMTGMSSFLHYADFFAVGLFLYVYGLEEARGLRTLRPAARPGGLPLILGTCICFFSLLSRLGRMEVHGVLSYVYGILATLSAGVFLILACKAWRVFHFKSLPGIAKRWTDGLRLGLFLTEAAAAAAAGTKFLPLLILMAAAASKKLQAQLESEGENGV